MMRKFALTAVIGAVLSACAQSPDAIAPAYVSEVPYRSWACADLIEEVARVEGALVTASLQQEDARTNDTVGVIFLGLPVASLSGQNVAPQIARLKGEQIALGRVVQQNGCAPRGGAGADAAREGVAPGEPIRNAPDMPGI